MYFSGLEVDGVEGMLGNGHLAGLRDVESDCQIAYAIRMSGDADVYDRLTDLLLFLTKK